VTLTETLKSLERDGVDTENLSNAALRSVFAVVGAGYTAKESIPKILIWLASNPKSTAEQAVEQLHLKMLTSDELNIFIEEKVAENRKLVEQMGMKAMGPLMGIIMEVVRGRAEAKEVQALLLETLSNFSKD
jgi:glutamyl-tRNA(Gln) amidotransferase subunit E